MTLSMLLIFSKLNSLLNEDKEEDNAHFIRWFRELNVIVHLEALVVNG